MSLWVAHLKFNLTTTVVLAMLSLLACTVHAVEWRPLAAPAGMQSMIDLASVRNAHGAQHFLLRREYTEARALPSGKPFRSTRINYAADCATQSVTPTLTAYYGDDRRLTHSEQHARVPRSAYTPALPGSDIAEALVLTCQRLATHANADVPSRSDPKPQVAQRGDSSGSGIVLNENGDVLTSHHVVASCAAHEVIDENNQPFRAALLASDVWRDLALLRVDKRFTHTARLRTDAAPRLGEAIAVVGYPLVSVLGTKPTVGFGHVSATTGINDSPAQMQISAPIQRGHSGGPLFDQAGNVIGVVTSKLDALKIAASVGDLPQNVNFAIRGDVVRAFLEAQHVSFTSSRETARLESTDIAAQGALITVRVRCLR